eukprot:Hpha_TRINITY_DN15777_c1_g4::TRINITY_DN15777_c1_g4_i1::g.40296::m.40296/K20495/CYP704B1; long-chain fatty acid omega-monooxygenase
MMWLQILASVAAGVGGLMVWMGLQRRKERKGIPGPSTPTPFFFESLPTISGLVGPAAGNSPEGAKHLNWLIEQSAFNKHKTWAFAFPWKTEMVISSKECMEHVMKTHFGSHYVLGDHRRSVFGTLLGDGIFNTDGEHWEAHRKASSHLFTARQLRSRMTSVFKANAVILKEILSQSAGTDAELDLQNLFLRYTFDSFMNIAFGVEAKTLAGDPTGLAVQRAFDRAQEATFLRFFDPFCKLKRIINVGSEKVLSEAVEEVNRYVLSGIRDRRDDEDGVSEDDADLLTLYIDECRSRGQAFDEKDLRDLVLNFILAGRDTTAAVQTWMVLELSRNPEVLRRCEEESRRETDVNRMHFLQAVFQETLRLHPSVPTDFKECIRDDVLPDGTKVHAGVLIGFHPIAACQNPEVFPEPEKFKPERWMNEAGECRSYDEYTYPCFNAGPRLCLGRHMAALEAKMVISELISELRLEIDPKFERKIRLALTLQSKNGLPARVSRRKP